MSPFSLTSDFIDCTGPTDSCLRLTARGGFTHVHWCHHWNDDFIYTETEIDEIARQLSEYNLKFLDCHGSAGIEKDWRSTCESRRQAGVELVKNRVEFTARLGGDCVVLHGPRTFD